MSLHLNLAPDLFIAILVFDKPVLFRVEEAWELLSRIDSLYIQQGELQQPLSRLLAGSKQSHAEHTRYRGRV